MHRHLRLTSAWLVGCAVAFGGLASPQPGRSADNPIKDVSYAKRGGAFELSVAASGPVTTRVSRFAVDAKHDVQDLVVDVSPASYNGQTKVIGFSKGQLQQVRVGQLSASPAVMRIVVESTGSAKYDLSRSGGRSVTLSVHTDQVAFALPAAQAISAARSATGRHDLAIAAATAQGAKAATAPSKTAVVPAKPVTAPAKPLVAKPAKHVAVATAPARVVAVTPAVVAMATPNPWLPGGKYYCKVPGQPGYRSGAMGSHEAAPHHGMAPPPPPPAGTGQSMDQGNINLDVKNADILDVLKLLANESGQNIIATQNVKGTVTTSLHDVPLRTALDLIVHTNGLDYRRLGNIYVVGTQDDLNKQFGSVGQVATQTVAFPIKYASPVELGKQLGTVIPTSSYTIDARTDTVLVSGTPDIIQSARNFLALSDVPAPEVVFEVKVLDITHNNDQSNTGVQWVGSSDFDLFENCIACPAGTVVPVTVTSGNPIAPQPFTRNALFIQGKINYLISHNEAQMLASPRVTALDNQQASLLVGQTYPLVYYDPRSGQFQAQYIDIGVKLIITPVINTDGYITTTMHVERSVIAGLVQQFPILNNRKTDNILRVKDGETIVLGGLMDEQDTKSITKIPLLGDIPIFGALFKNIQRSKLRNEVVFLITPHIVAEH